MTTQNTIAAGVIALANALFPFLRLVGVLDWSADTIAAAMLVVTTAVTLAGLIYAQATTKKALATPPPPNG